ncbi:hypothetical protein AB2B38_001545 [Balneola sp. MJW-20]|uniref:hypothetical protein n=1 Tax=Gracilimonas aurantiaca TaxID=3234185 RepID=UPI0034656A6C
MKFYYLLLFFALSISCSRPGNTNSFEDHPAGKDISSFPRFYQVNDTLLFMSWVETKDDSSSLRYSTFSNDGWSDPLDVAKGTDWFINWADFPELAANNEGLVASTWLKKSSPDTYSYDTWIQVSGSGKPFVVHNDSTKTEHGFVSMEMVTDSTFMVVWLDGRQTADRERSEYSDINKSMSLRGALLDLSGRVLNRYLIDDSVCDCCNTSLTKTQNGLIVFFRDRNENEIRDIKFARFDGEEWNNPELVAPDNWQIAACPVNGPSSSYEDGKTLVSWFTGANNKAAVKWRIIDGDSPAEIRISDNNSPEGRVQALLRNSRVFISWIDRNGILLVNEYDLQGKFISQPFKEEITKNRNTGFPQLSMVDNNLVVAWTSVTETGKSLRTRIIDLPNSE